ncbi:HCL019Wp [Eremothecium sinecaudum]|uniref:HCL019Wp n=1 Tax=Eremothecium sinecaudum TaxID=45286 RepID=A0A109UYP1_9SACH|nr:HCL019Wp [Eremothecium sinecaudum]AMD20132.1 HCL019Wp [Eremothecium sinecaudum]
MFESPITSYNNTERKRRKLKYKYINYLTRRYELLIGKQNSHNTDLNVLPTPDNSAAEFSDADLQHDDIERNQRTKKRRRVRLRSVLRPDGNYDDYNPPSDYSNLEDGLYGNDSDENNDSIPDPEKEFHSKYHKPQETYEVWVTSRKKRVPIQKKVMGYHTFKKLEKYAQHKTSSTLALASRSLIVSFEGMQLGYETCPKEQITNYQRMHLNHLTNLLYISIYREDWDTAYRCFALLIRMELVDLRSIWNLGSRILENYAYDTKERLLEWMSTVHNSYEVFSQNTKHQFDPVFRSGSRTHIPNYVLGWLWFVLEGATKGETTSSGHSISWLLEKISELLLRPTYSDSPEMWFINAMCYFVQADKLSLQLQKNSGNDAIYGSELDIARNQVIQHIHNTKNCLQTTKDKGGFSFPELIITDFLTKFEKRLYATNDEMKKGHSTAQQETEDSIDMEDLHTNEEFALHTVQNLNPEIVADDYEFIEQPIQFGIDSGYSSSE